MGKTHEYFKWVAKTYAGPGRVKDRPRFVVYVPSFPLTSSARTITDVGTGKQMTMYVPTPLHSTPLSYPCPFSLPLPLTLARTGQVEVASHANPTDRVGDAKRDIRVQGLGLPDERLLGYFCRTITLLWRLFPWISIRHVLAFGESNLRAAIKPYVVRNRTSNPLHPP